MAVLGPGAKGDPDNPSVGSGSVAGMRPDNPDEKTLTVGEQLAAEDAAKKDN